MKIKELKNKYKQVYELYDGIYLVSTKNKNEVVEVDYAAHTNIDEVYGMEGNWGIVDEYGNIIIEPAYIYPFLECGDNFQVMLPYEYKKIDGKEKVLTLKHGLINKKGDIIIPIKYIYMEVMDNSGEYFRVVDSKTYKSGVIDKNNKLVIPFDYDFIQASPDLEIMKNSKYCDLYPEHIYQVKVVNNDLYGVYDLKLGCEIIKPKYKHLKIIGYNRFLIGEDYFKCNTLIDEKEKIIKTFENKIMI